MNHPTPLNSLGHSPQRPVRWVPAAANPLYAALRWASLGTSVLIAAQQSAQAIPTQLSGSSTYCAACNQISGSLANSLPDLLGSQNTSLSGLSSALGSSLTGSSLPLTNVFAGVSVASSAALPSPTAVSPVTGVSATTNGNPNAAGSRAMSRSFSDINVTGMMNHVAGHSPLSVPQLPASAQGTPVGYNKWDGVSELPNSIPTPPSANPNWTFDPTFRAPFYNSTTGQIDVNNAQAPWNLFPVQGLPIPTSAPIFFPSMPAPPLFFGSSVFI